MDKMQKQMSNVRKKKDNSERELKANAINLKHWHTLRMPLMGSHHQTDTVEKRIGA